MLSGKHQPHSEASSSDAYGKDGYLKGAHNVAPHLPPPGKLVERKQDIQILPNRRADSTGGG
jgi:hypothetical protein